jgi:hypothetical protein
MGRDTWDNLAHGDWMAISDLQPFVAAHPDRAVDVGVPLVPQGSGEPINDLLEEAISGAKDQVYRSLGQALASYGPATVYARVWWEMNMRPDPADSIDRRAFREAWAHAVPIIREGFAAVAREGQVLRIVFCPISDGADFEEFWPGDEFVDIVAMDAYGSRWGSSAPSADDLLDSVRSDLNRLSSFGATHDKPVALGEWGNLQANAAGTASQGLGDFPQYVELIFEWARKNRAVYLVYFNLSDGGVGQTLTETPRSLAEVQAQVEALN